MRLTLISGRDVVHMLAEARSREAKVEGRAEVLVHPWTEVHVADAAKAFERMIQLANHQHLIIVTFQDWLFNLVGEIIDLRPAWLDRNDVEVVLCEKGEARIFTYDAKGFLSDGWPIGYFTYDNLDPKIIVDTQERIRYSTFPALAKVSVFKKEKR